MIDFSFFDARNYRTVDVVEGYGIWADIYDAGVTDFLDLDLLERIRTVPWAECSSAADLACGTGRVGAWLRRQGVAVIDGVDLSEPMLRRARARTYRRLEVGDMCAPVLAREYDLVTNVLAVEHAADLAGLYREAARLLRPGGWFVLVGFHPHFLLNGIPTHFRNVDGENIAIENHLHLISDHVAIATALGFSLLEMHERMVDEAWIAAMPTYERHLHRPISFLLAWKAPATPVF